MNYERIKEIMEKVIKFDIFTDYTSNSKNEWVAIEIRKEIAIAIAVVLGLAFVLTVILGF